MTNIPGEPFRVKIKDSEGDSYTKEATISEIRDSILGFKTGYKAVSKNKVETLTTSELNEFLQTKKYIIIQ